MSKVWFVTGSSRGLGRGFVEAALSRGDRVAASARTTASLDELVAAYGDAVLPLELDVTDKAAVFESVRRAKEHCPSCASRRPGTSSRCPRSPGSSRCRSAARTTSRSGPSKP